jgi:hypothetical protein
MARPPRIRTPAIAYLRTSNGPALLQRPLFDHLVGAQQQGCGHVEAERFGGLEIDDQLDFRDLLHRQVGRLLALEDAARMDAGLLVR